MIIVFPPPPQTILVTVTIGFNSSEITAIQKMKQQLEMVDKFRKPKVKVIEFSEKVYWYKSQY